MYEHVLSPIDVGGVEIPNRVVPEVIALKSRGDCGQPPGLRVFLHGFRVPLTG
jgi:hypothetical protein